VRAVEIGAGCWLMTVTPFPSCRDRVVARTSAPRRAGRRVATGTRFTWGSTARPGSIDRS